MSAVAEALRKRPSSGAVSISELWRGTVAEVFSDGTAQVIVPRLGGPDPIGRIESLVPNLAIGARVIVGAIEGRRDDLVVLSVLGDDGTVIGAGAFTSVELASLPTLPEHAVRKDYADALGAVSAVADTIVRRGASGSIIVQDVYLNGAQLAANAATTKAYVDNLIAGRYATAPTVIPAGADLNTYTTPGFYHQPANANAASGTNYPSALAGLLEVYVSGGMVYHRYTYYNSGIIVTRSKYSTTWYGWKELSVVGHTHAYSQITGLPSSFPSDWSTLSGIPATFAPSAHSHAGTDVAVATGSVQGAMSAADKAKLDAATDVNTASTLVMRSSGGWLNSFGVNVTQTAPTSASHLTRKDYVDAQVATRAPSTHAHTYADISGTVPTSALPPLAVNDVFTVASQTAMLALTAQRGDMAIRTDTGKSYALSTDSPGTLADWKELMAAGQVVSVASKTGVVTLVKADVGLGSVDNTSDAAKPISTATQTALNGKAASSHGHAIADVTSLQSTLDGKAASSHTHTIANVTSLQSSLDAKASITYADSLVAKYATASAAGKESFAAVAAGGVSSTINVVFPAGRFSAEPSLAFGSNDPRLSFSATGVSATGFSVRAFNYTTAASGAAAACWWTATQP